MSYRRGRRRFVEEDDAVVVEVADVVAVGERGRGDFERARCIESRGLPRVGGDGGKSLLIRTCFLVNVPVVDTATAFFVRCRVLDV